MRHQQQLEAEEDYQSRVLYELCSMIHRTLKFPYHPYPFPSSSSSSSSSSSQPWWTMLSWAAVSSSQNSPAAFASMFLGISLTLMLFGSATFLVGFIMLPWVTLLVVIFCVASLVSNLSKLLNRLILGSTTFHNNDFTYEARKFLKLWEGRRIHLEFLREQR
ncbi:uncharacterized protein LOC107494756 isoform X2 [Arachis duranensis]|uniref:Uncharacterized protein LOC107494756 isoform X2 n=1 Tax=Arachis duranensis TaxID=130453 RepID=A0A6P4DNK9_ARADU|nr:uncharacterized protein LOC107494756 isoform X2 [Arachis duranensis]